MGHVLTKVLFNMRMRIPRFLNNLTLKQYVDFRKIETKQYEDEAERVEDWIELFTGLSKEQVRELPIYKVQLLATQIGRLRNTPLNTRVNKTIWIKGKRYKCVKNEYHLNTNQLVSAETFRLSTLDNYHRLAAIVYMRAKYFKEPVFDSKNFEDLAKEYLNVKVGKIFGAVFFYSKRLIRLRTISQHYLKSSLTQITEREKEIEQQLKSLGIDTDGTTSSIVSQLETLSKKQS